MPEVVVSRSLLRGVTGMDVAFFIVALMSVFVLLSDSGAGLKTMAVIGVAAYVIKSGLGIFIAQKRKELRDRLDAAAPILKGFELRRRSSVML